MPRGWKHIRRGPWLLRCLPHAILRRTLVAKLRGVPKRKKSKLEDLPEDILTKIFFHACTDGGPTGSSLALVSKRIHNLSRPARFNTVSLLSGSPAKVVRFLDSYKSVCAEATASGIAPPTLNHLALTLSPSLTEPLPGIAQTAQERERRAHLKVVRRDYGAESRHWHALVTTVAHEYAAAVQAVLVVAAPDVQTLCLYRHNITADQIASPPIRFGTPFARLRELSFAGDEPRFVVVSDSEDEGSEEEELEEEEDSDPDDASTDAGTTSTSGGSAYVPPFPVLERLHVMSGKKSVLKPKRWVRDAPNLTELRVTWLRGIPESAFLHGLCDVVSHFDKKQQQQQQQSDSSNTNSPPNTAKFVFASRPTPFKAGGSHAARDYYNKMCEFRADVWSARSPVVFVPYYWDQDVGGKLWKSGLVSEGALWRDWLARSAGREGLFKAGFWSRFMADEWKDKAEIALHTGSEDYLSPLITVRDVMVRGASSQRSALTRPKSLQVTG